jgi:hypothetical protein
MGERMKDERRKMESGDWYLVIGELKDKKAAGHENSNAQRLFGFSAIQLLN